MNTDEDGYVSQSITVSGLVAGIYNVSEDESSRYYLSSISNQSSNATLNEDNVSIDLTSESNGCATFTNGKYEYEDYSDNKTLAN